MIKGVISTAFIILLIMPSTNGTGSSTWKERGAEFQDGEKNNTTLENDSIVLDKNLNSTDTWSMVFNESGPPARYQHSMAYDSIDGVHILYGGFCNEQPLNDGWAYNLSTNNWSSIRSLPYPYGYIGCNNGQAMAFDPQNCVTMMIGGYYSWIQSWSMYNEGFRYNYSNNSWEAFLDPPAQRAFASMTYDPIMNMVVLFGGETYTGGMMTPGVYISRNDTWVYDCANRSWMNRSSATAPPARHSQSMCFDPGSGLIVLFGGTNNTDIFQDTWTYDPYTNVWSERHPANKPPAAFGAVMAENPVNGTVILFGGQGISAMTNETWSYNATKNEWIHIPAENGPSPRDYPTLTYDVNANKLFLFAGKEQSGEYRDDYWTYDLENNSWSKRGELSSPMPRYGACSGFNVKKNVGVLFGGFSGTGSGYELNDTWTYDTSKNKWTQMHSKTPPPARRYAAMCYDTSDSLFVLFGGQGGHGTLNDTWLYHPETNSWSECHPAISPPTVDGCCMAYDPSGGSAILFGGRMDNGSPYISNETWAFNASTDTWTNRTLSIAPTARDRCGMVYDEENKVLVLFGGTSDDGGTWILDPSTFSWNRKYPNVSPSRRDDPAMTFDNYHKVVILFGGLYGYDLGDTWEYNAKTDTWTCISPAVSPSSQEYASLFFDSNQHVAVLCGGMLGDTWLFGLRGRYLYGTYTSIPKDMGGNAYFGDIGWNESLPPSTYIKLQLRSGSTFSDMIMKSFTGPDGTAESFFTDNNQKIPPIHNGSNWIQYSAFLYTENVLRTPALSSVEIKYNLIHDIAITSPAGADNWTGSRCITWTASDKDNDSLEFDIYLDNGSSLILLAGNLSNETHKWQCNTTSILNGTYRIKIVSRDDNPSIPLTVNATSANFTIFHQSLPNHPPHVVLISPANNSVVNSTTVRLAWTGIDVDGDLLSYKSQYSDNPQMQGATKINLTDQFLDISNLSDNITYYWTVSAFDGKPNGTSLPIDIWSFTVRLPPANIPVRFTSTPDSTAWVGKEYTYNLTSIDEDGDIPIFSIVSAPATMTLDPSTGKLRWTPTSSDIGNHTISVRVSDGRGSTDNQTFTITVKEIPSPPVILPKCAITYPANGTRVNVNIRIRGTATNGSLPLSAIKLRIDNGSWFAAIGLESWTFNLDTACWAEGNHRVEAKAFAANLSSETASVDFTVSNPEPTVTISINPWCLPAILTAVVAGVAVLMLMKKRGNR